MFSPKTRYDILNESIQIRDFHDYKEEFVVRPPYQRKNVWDQKRKQQLLDSLFRRYYIPRIVIREVRLDETRTKREVIDGQQRIITAQQFLADELPLPKSLADVDPDLPGKRYSSLSSDIRRFVDRELKYNADIIKNISDPRNPEHQKIAADIFWRLQQGETLNFMEVAHARLNSLSRNFVVKYADDITFDYDKYEPIEKNPHKHPFFRCIRIKNNRMQHLMIITRFLILETNNGNADIRNRKIGEFIDQHRQDDGIGNFSFENTPEAKRTLANMKRFYEVFAEDVSTGSYVPELGREYFIISMYLLLRHLTTYYVVDEAERALFRSFVLDFHKRWSSSTENDLDILNFSSHRQQSANEIETRHRILRQLFFEHAILEEHDMLTKDERRMFNEAERIEVYRRDRGLCQICLQEGLPEKEAHVPWHEYETDHVIPHAKGGATDVENAQVLCRRHNLQKGARTGVTA